MNKQQGFIGIVLLITLILGVVAGGGYYLISKNKTNQPEGIACTMEAKQCPDGSYVGRTGPKCEFAVCPN